jgi:catechol 2,3-dioxygenase-like lactoylglutathione lyase family enzyme
MLRRIDRIVLRVQHLPSAVRYYRDVLGLKLLKEDLRIASLKLADSETELVLHNDPDLPAEATYYLVDDVKAIYEKRADLKLQFMQPPAKIARGYRATIRDPFGNVMLIVDRSAESSGSAVIEDAKPAGALFSGVESTKPSINREVLSKTYEQIGRTADDLPYTPDFEKLYTRSLTDHKDPKPTREEIWRTLLNMRKAAKLPKLGEARSRPPEISPEERIRLREMLGADIGKRDRLPYTKRFDQLVDEFNKGRGRPLSPHLVWRLVATLAK